VKRIHLAIGCIIIFAAFPFVVNSQVTDIEGNTYKTIQIGSQIWMAENLRTTKYNNGSDIPLVSGSEWCTMETHGYCWYNNDLKIFGKVYGALYNWNTVNSGNLCPYGWHVPTDAEWTTLSDYLGGEKSAGGLLKESGTKHWKSPNSGATNKYRFSALPGGGRWVVDRFDLNGRRGYWWSSSLFDDNIDVAIRVIQFDDSLLKRAPGLKGSGFSVRCIKD
jgi:uncharacterized protein (TIGR02145 family)